MDDASRSGRVGWALAVALGVLGCDAPTSRTEPAREQAVTPAPATKEAAPAVVRRPVVPGYLAPADAKQAAPSETKQAAVVDAKPAAAAAEVPAWRRLLAETRALGASGVWEDIGRMREREAQAFAAIRALPEDDPGYVEAQCELAVRGNVGADVEAALLGAIARVRAQSLADPYAFLDRDDLLTTELNAAIDDDGKVRLAPGTILTGIGDCAQVDVAMLTMMLIESYHSYGMFRRAYEGTPPPKVEDPFKAASQALLALHAELVRTYGAKHARPAGLVERLYWACHWSHRKKHPKICYAEKDQVKAYEAALAAREATYGEDHPLTRASLLRVGAERLADRPEEGQKLLARAMAGELETEPRATAAALVALLALQAGKTEEGLALFGRVEAAGDRAYGDDWWSHGQVLQLAASALRAAHRDVEALRVFRRYLAIQPAVGPGYKALPWPGFAELLAAAGEREEALKEFEKRIAYAVELEQTGANAPARQMGRDKRIADLKARADVRRAAGDEAGAAADLAAVRAIEQGPPVTPDR